jgi:hypothetical protein
MPRKKREHRDPVSFLAEKSPQEIAEALKDKRRDELLTIIALLVRPLDQITASQLAKRCQVPKAEILADMRAGRFYDPIEGPGFFTRSPKGSAFKVTRLAAARWMRSMFVHVRPEISLPARKKSAAAQNGLVDEKATQKRRLDSLERQLVEGCGPGDQGGVS